MIGIRFVRGLPLSVLDAEDSTQSAWWLSTVVVLLVVVHQ